MAKHDKTSADVTARIPSLVPPPVPVAVKDEAGKIVASATPPAPAAPKKGVKKEPLKVFFATAEEAAAEAANRTKGPRKAYVVKVAGKADRFVVHNNEGRAAGAAAMADGYICDEIGKKGRGAAKPLSVDEILALAASLPKELLAKLLEGK